MKLAITIVLETAYSYSQYLKRALLVTASETADIVIAIETAYYNFYISISELGTEKVLFGRNRRVTKTEGPRATTIILK